MKVSKTRNEAKYIIKIWLQLKIHQILIDKRQRLYNLSSKNFLIYIYTHTRARLFVLGGVADHGVDVLSLHVLVVADVGGCLVGGHGVQALDSLLDLVLRHFLVAQAELRLEDRAPGLLAAARPHGGPDGGHPDVVLTSSQNSQAHHVGDETAAAMTLLR